MLAKSIKSDHGKFSLVLSYLAMVINGQGQGQGQGQGHGSKMESRQSRSRK
jgi:hypothetical protein